MIGELDTVVLTHDVATHGLKAGDVGAVVHASAADDVFEVEFVSADGTTVAVLTLSRLDIRPIGAGEILNARSLSSA